MNPYKVLGVSENATEEEIKKAYRTLSRRYHPDANINNPNKAQAEEKFKEVQQAYELIMDMRQKGYSYSDGSYSSGGAGSGSGGYRGGFDFGGFDFGGFSRNAEGRQGTDQQSMHMQAAANYINSGHYREALNVLESIDDRNGQWYYFSALASSGIGNNIQALDYARTAVSLEPDNGTYRMFLQRLQSGGSWYRDMQSPYGTSVVPGDSFCLRVCLLNLFCNLCCGGGFCYGCTV